jgi:hypothetical protein
MIHLVIPSWAWGGTSNEADRRKPRRPDEFELQLQRIPDIPAEGPHTSEPSEDGSTEL